MLKTILLGIVQGLSEFLPISSSGHLVLLQKLLNMPETNLLLEILLHVGTLAAVAAIFWRDWLEMLRHPLQSRSLRLLIVATVPAVIAAVLLGDALDRAFGGWFLGASFLITSALLLVSDTLERRAAGRPMNGGKHRRQDVEDMRIEQALAMGVMQAVAIVPGISRSGSTIVGGLASGVTRQTAAKFSFMMSAVAIVGSLVFKFKDLVDTIQGEGVVFEGGLFAVLLGMLAAAVTGYAAIRWMLKLITKHGLRWFGLYTAALGLLVLLDQLFFGLVFDRII